MTTTIAPKRALVKSAAAKEPSLATLAKDRARGKGGLPTAGKPSPSIVDAVVTSMRTRAGKLAHCPQVKNIDDINLLTRVAGGGKPTAAEVVTLMCLFERHSKYLNGEANGHGRVHPAAKNTTLPAGIMANDASADGTTTENVPGNGKAKAPPLPAAESRAVVWLELSLLERHPDNRHPTDDDVRERAESIKAKGQLEPIIVRRLASGRYQVLSGETRWLAVKRNGGKSIEARIRECDDATALELVAEANGQRKDLNPIERARLIEKLCTPVTEGGSGLTKDAAALRVGLKDGSSASNLTRLLKLPEPWLSRVAAGELPESFARMLLPVINLAPVMKELEKEWADRNQAKDEWEYCAFDSRAALQEAIDDELSHSVKRMDETHWMAGKDRKLDVDLADKAIRKQLGIVDIQLPNDKGQTETVAVATNVKAHNELLRRQRERLEKERAENAGRESKPRKAQPKRELTAAEKKANAAKQAKFVVQRRATWRHEWLKVLVAERLSDQDWQATKLLCWAITHFNAWPVNRGGSWPAKMNEAIGEAGGRGTGWRALASLKLTSFSPPVGRNHRMCQRSFQLDEVVANWLRLIVLQSEDRDPHHPVIPHDVLDGVAADYEIDLAKEWALLQGTKEGRERLERLFLGHQSAQLRELATEMGTYLPENATRGGMVKILMAKIAPGSSTRFKLPKCIKPLPAADGKAKGKKGKS